MYTPEKKMIDVANGLLEKLNDSIATPNSPETYKYLWSLKPSYKSFAKYPAAHGLMHALYWVLKQNKEPKYWTYLVLASRVIGGDALRWIEDKDYMKTENKKKHKLISLIRECLMEVLKEQGLAPSWGSGGALGGFEKKSGAGYQQKVQTAQKGVQAAQTAKQVQTAGEKTVVKGGGGAAERKRRETLQQIDKAIKTVAMQQPKLDAILQFLKGQL